jgi:hypothetical protein
MNAGRTVFSQLIEHAPGKEFQKCVARYRGDAHFRGFSCWDQYLAMAFAQLTYRESLRDIEACLRSMKGKLYHMGFRGRVARATLADANETHDWRIFADFAQVLISMARPRRPSSWCAPNPTSCCNAATLTGWTRRQVFAPITPSSLRPSTRPKHIRMLCGGSVIWMWKPRSASGS